jgi:hypothetical protein
VFVFLYFGAVNEAKNFLPLVILTEAEPHRGEAERKDPEDARSNMPLQGIFSRMFQQRQRRRRG